LATLIAADRRYLDSLQVESPIRGVVLIDAGGLDMYAYLLNTRGSRQTVPVYFYRPGRRFGKKPLPSIT
jgi:hypothetical protein